MKEVYQRTAFTPESCWVIDSGYVRKLSRTMTFILESRDAISGRGRRERTSRDVMSGFERA